MKAVLGALAVTAVAFVVIFGLDKVAEAWPKDGDWCLPGGFIWLRYLAWGYGLCSFGFQDGDHRYRYHKGKIDFSGWW